MPIRRHHLDIYGVHLYLATTKKQWKKLRKELSYLEASTDYSGLTHFAIWEPSDGGPHAAHLAFWIDPKTNTTPAELVNTAAHEATHGAAAIFDWIEQDTNGTNNEPLAYLVGWLTEWLWGHLTEGDG